MSIITFNTPRIIATPISDAFGNVLVNPVPVILEGVQSFTLNFKGSLQALFADKQFAWSGIRGDASLQGKITAVRQSAELISDLYTGQGFDSTTTFQQVYLGLTGPIPAASPSNGAELYIIPCASFPNKGLLLPDLDSTTLTPLGVLDSSGNAYGTRVIGVPSAPKEWFFGTSHITGSPDICYSFYFYDIFPNYPTDSIQGFVPYVSVTGRKIALTSGTRHLKIKNIQSGSSPIIQLTVAAEFNGKKMTLILPRTMSSSLNFLSTRSMDFSGYELDFECFPNNTSDQTVLEGFFLE